MSCSNLKAAFELEQNRMLQSTHLALWVTSGQCSLSKTPLLTLQKNEVTPAWLSLLPNFHPFSTGPFRTVYGTWNNKCAYEMSISDLKRHEHWGPQWFRRSVKHFETPDLLFGEKHMITHTLFHVLGTNSKKPWDSQSLWGSWSPPLGFYLKDGCNQMEWVASKGWEQLLTGPDIAKLRRKWEKHGKR